MNSFILFGFIDNGSKIPYEPLVSENAIHKIIVHSAMIWPIVLFSLICIAYFNLMATNSRIRHLIKDHQLNLITLISQALPMSITRYYQQKLSDSLYYAGSTIRGTAFNFNLDDKLKDNLSDDDRKLLKSLHKNQSIFKRLFKTQNNKDVLKLVTKIQDKYTTNIGIMILCMLGAMDIYTVFFDNNISTIGILLAYAGLVVCSAIILTYSSITEQNIIDIINKYIEKHTNEITDYDLLHNLDQFEQTQSILKEYIAGHENIFILATRNELNFKSKDSLVINELVPKLQDIYNHLSILEGISLVTADDMQNSPCNFSNDQINTITQSIAQNFNMELTSDGFLNKLTLVITELNDENLIRALSSKQIKKNTDLKVILNNIIQVLNDFDNRIIKSIKHGFNVTRKVKSDIQTQLLTYGQTDYMDFDLVGHYYRLIEDHKLDPTKKDNQ